MRKGEKLYNQIVKKLHDESEIKYCGLDNQDANVGSSIRQMSDEEFDKILKPDLKENEILCSLCQSIVWRNPKFPLDNDEKEDYICDGCEEAVNAKRFY